MAGSMNREVQDFDVIIVGGGLVGASLACALLPMAKRHGMRIAVVEAVPLPSLASEPYQPSYDARGTALSYGTRLIYEEMGVWQALSERVCAIEHIHVSDRGHFGTTRLHAAEESVAALGYVVENHWIGRVLLSHLQQQGGEAISWLCPAEVTAITMAAERAQVTIHHQDQQQQLSAALVVLAEGGRSSLSEQLSLDYQEAPYNQFALVSTLTPGKAHAGVAFERFTAEGPLALLPLTDSDDGSHRCALVWTTPDELIGERMDWDDATLLKEVQQVFGYRLGRFSRIGERYCYPLALKQAREQVRSRLVVLGNGAHALHPIAGQGYNLALRGVADLAERLGRLHQQGEDLGQLTHLNAFVEQRRQDQMRTIAFSDKVMKVFAEPRFPVQLVRDLGLVGLNMFAPARHRLARAAMGLDGTRARLHGA